MSFNDAAATPDISDMGETQLQRHNFAGNRGPLEQGIIEGGDASIEALEQELRLARQRAEAAERRADYAESRLREAIETMPEGFALYDEDDRLVLCNAQYRSLYPKSHDIIVPGARFVDILQESIRRGEYEDAEKNPGEWLAKRLEQHTLAASDFEQELADGRCLRVRERRLSDGGHVGVRIDVTDLKEREQTFRLLFDSNPVPMWVYDRETLRMLNVNASALAQYRYDRDTFLSLTIDDLRLPEEIAPLHTVLGAPEPANGRYGVWRHRRADGEVFEVEIVSSRFLFGGRPASLVAAIDMTTQRKAENELRQAKEEAEAANRSKSQFLANMSHELRTPLNAIIGFSTLIKDAMMGPLSDRYREYGGDIHSSGHHLLSLINDILDLSKIEAGRLELAEEWIDAKSTIGECCQLVTERARERGVIVDERVPTELPALLVDQRRFKQILLNLLSNAVKFTPAGGHVTISASTSPGEGAVITVTDTGIGMRPQDIPAALEPFRQLEGAFNRRFEGTGLGLPLAKTLVELHGGTLQIDSAQGRGTTVAIRLPDRRVAHRKP